MFLWLRRHKGKFLLLGAAVAGSYVGGRWLLQKAVELQETRRASEAEGTRLQRHNENNYKTSLTAVVSLLPRLREAVQCQLNVESITEELKTTSSSKVTLWENLKIICFTRVVVSVYVCCSVCTVLRVQLSALGGDLSLRHRDQSGGEGGMAQQQYLATVHYLTGEGLHQMVQCVRQAAEKVLVSYSLKHRLSLEGVQQLLRDIHALSASSSLSPWRPGDQRGEQMSFLVQYLMPKEQLLETAVEMSHMSAVTRDLMESGEFSSVLEGCVELGLSLTCRQLADIYHSTAQSETTLPVARVIPLIADMFDVQFSSQHNRLVQEVVSCPKLHKLSQNIFEAFSQLTSP